MNKGPLYCDPSLRGSEQIRTAVKGFADLCLATRPRNRMAKISQVLTCKTIPPPVCIGITPGKQYQLFA